MADKKKMPWGLRGEGLKPAAKISESKLKSFNIGTMNLAKKGMSQREKEELKKKQDELEAAEIYNEFVASFDDVGKHGKTWVKGEVVNPDKAGPGRHQAERPGKAKGRLYKPTSKLAELAATFQSVKQQPPVPEEKKIERPILPIKKKEEKKKSNLELFKEELKIIQEEREERHKMKQEILGGNDSSRKSRFEPPEVILPPMTMRGPADDYKESYPNFDDQTTTNLYLGNINPKMTEKELCEIFGKFGPLASVKVMWPRSEEERARGRNCGFVAFMNRKDGERALANLQGRDVMQFTMKLGWGKAVPIPPHPVYIPPALMELTLPPPPSGMPFNAQPTTSSKPTSTPASRRDKGFSNVPPPDLDSGQKPDVEAPPSDPKEFEKMLANAVVKVVIPTERTLLHLIHRMVEFVVREGPMFEAMIMNREIQNPMFRFLFENQSPAHVYYRWKLFSILQGDSPNKWRLDEFRMFKMGSIWKPPVMNPYTQGMPDELLNSKKLSEEDLLSTSGEPKRGQLSESQRDRFEDMLRELIPERMKIGDTMVWCLEHGESAEEIVDCITESLSILQTPIPKKIARLFLISDILYNCSAKVPHASSYRRYFESKLPEVFKDIHESYKKIEARLRAEQFKQKVMNCFRAWEDWAVYPNDFLINLQNIFLGLVVAKEEKKEELDGAPLSDLDGAPFSDIDGMPLTGESIAMLDKAVEELDGTPIGPEDMDGAPIGDDLDGMPFDKSGGGGGLDGSPTNKAEDKPKFTPCKWESVDQQELENQAMTTSKWELLEQEEEEKQKKAAEERLKAQISTSTEDVDGMPMEDQSSDSGGEDSSQYDTPSRDRHSNHSHSREGSASREDRSDHSRLEMTEERRAKLREIELKVVKYQDELEMGKRSRKPHLSLAEQIQHYRSKLLAKEEEKERERIKEKKREDDREKIKEWERARDRDRGHNKDREKDRERDRRERREEETPKARRKRSPSTSPEPIRRTIYRSRSPPTAYKESEDSPQSERRRQRSRSRSPKKRRRSKSPKKSRRSRSRSRSPGRKHKHKKSKHRQE